jgi:hypothetical protein
VLFSIKYAIYKAINVEYNYARAGAAKRLAERVANVWPNLLGHLAAGSGRYTVHNAAFADEVSPPCCVSAPMLCSTWLSHVDGCTGGLQQWRR